MLEKPDEYVITFSNVYEISGRYFRVWTNE